MEGGRGRGVKELGKGGGGGSGGGGGRRNSKPAVLVVVYLRKTVKFRGEESSLHGIQMIVIPAPHPFATMEK